MGELVFALCTRLILNNKNKNHKKIEKGCLMVMTDSTDLGRCNNCMSVVIVIVLCSESVMKGTE